MGGARNLLRRYTEDVRGDIAEVPELGLVDRHCLLLAEAAQRLTMLLGEAAALLGALTIGPWEDRPRDPNAWKAAAPPLGRLPSR